MAPIMNAFVVIEGKSYKTSRGSAEDCLRWLETLCNVSKGTRISFTFQPSTGFIFSSHGDGTSACGVLYREGYPVDLQSGKMLIGNRKTA